MPFQSEKQRRFLWAKHPEIARRWTDKYGSAIKDLPHHKRRSSLRRLSEKMRGK